MAWGVTGAHDIDAVVLENIRATLLRLFAQAQAKVDQVSLERGIGLVLEEIDAIQLALDLTKRQETLPLEPVNLAELTDQVLHKLYLAKVQDNIVFSNSTRYKAPVLAHKKFLHRSLESMAKAVVDFNPSGGLINLDFAASKYENGVKLGVFSEKSIFTAKNLSEIKNNIGKTTRPSSIVGPNTVAHLYIADSLLGAMGLTLRTSIKSQNRGLATVLPMSSQLRLI